MTHPEYFASLVTQTERDLGMDLICSEKSTPDTIETNESWNGDTIGYNTRHVSNVELIAHGFIWQHPHGAVIRGNFAKPICMATAIVDEDGGELDGEGFERKVGQAVVAKLGPISCLDEIYY
jgi:hypothetical protein